MKNWTLIEWTIVAILFVCLPLALYASYREHQAWQKFAVDHKCRVVGKIASTTTTGVGYGMTANGTMGTITTTNTTPEKTGYLCDDEITYWR